MPRSVRAADRGASLGKSRTSADWKIKDQGRLHSERSARGRATRPEAGGRGVNCGCDARVCDGERRSAKDATRDGRGDFELAQWPWPSGAALWRETVTTGGGIDRSRFKQRRLKHRRRDRR
jgi:hypothetical protein